MFSDRYWPTDRIQESHFRIKSGYKAMRFLNYNIPIFIFKVGEKLPKRKKLLKRNSLSVDLTDDALYEFLSGIQANNLHFRLNRFIAFDLTNIYCFFKPISTIQHSKTV